MEINQRNKQLDLLYDKYYDSIFERCFYYVNRKPIYFELVEDCVQDAFVLYILLKLFYLRPKHLIMSVIILTGWTFQNMLNMATITV